MLYLFNSHFFPLLNIHKKAQIFADEEILKGHVTSKTDPSKFTYKQVKIQHKQSQGMPWAQCKLALHGQAIFNVSRHLRNQKKCRGSVSAL